MSVTIQQQITKQIQNTDPMYIKANTVPKLVHICNFLYKNPEYDYNISDIALNTGVPVNSMRNYYIKRLLQLGLIRSYRMSGKQRMYQLDNWKS